MTGNTRNKEELSHRARNSASSLALAASAETPRSVSAMLASQDASRYFLRQYFRMTFALVAAASVAMYFFASPAFTSACYFGMAFPIITSFVSFLITEWAFEQPNMIFFLVAMMSIVVRLFNLLIAFCVGYLILKMNGAGVIVGLLATYFAYLVIEIAYIHNKGKVLGQ